MGEPCWRTPPCRCITTLKPVGLFVLAPAFYMTGYEAYTPQDVDCATVIVHGWRDDIVAADNSIRWALFANILRRCTYWIPTIRLEDQNRDRLAACCERSLGAWGRGYRGGRGQHGGRPGENRPVPFHAGPRPAGSPGAAAAWHRSPALHARVIRGDVPCLPAFR